jgi:hypothetical protein
VKKPNCDTFRKQNDESILFYGHLRCERERKKKFPTFVAMQQNPLDDAVKHWHISHVAVQQAAGSPDVLSKQT